MWRACFLGEIFAIAPLIGVIGQGNARIAALLRAVMHEAILADVEVARAGAASPFVFQALSNVVLELIHAREGALAERHNLFKNFPFALAQRLKLAVAVVQNANCGRESELDRAVRHFQGILRAVNSAAEDGIDVYVKLGMFSEKLELLIEHLQALLRDVVGHHVVDADLQILKSRAIQPIDSRGSEQIAVGDHSGDTAICANALDDGVEFRVQKRFAAADGDDAGAHRAEAVYAAEHFFRRDGL